MMSLIRKWWCILVHRDKYITVTDGPGLLVTECAKCGRAALRMNSGPCSLGHLLKEQALPANRPDMVIQGEPADYTTYSRNDAPMLD